MNFPNFSSVKSSIESTVLGLLSLLLLLLPTLLYPRPKNQLLFLFGLLMLLLFTTIAWEDDEDDEEGDDGEDGDAGMLIYLTLELLALDLVG